MASAREFVRLTVEDTFGTFNASPDPGEQFYISLPEDNAMTVRRKNNNQDIVSAGYRGQRVVRISKTYDVAGKLKTHLRPSQVPLFARLLVNLTPGNCPDLASFSLDHGFYLEDGACSPLITRYTGCKMSGTLSGAATATAQSVVVDLDIIGSQAVELDGATFTPPDPDDIPDYEVPLGFQDTAGKLIWGTGAGSIRTRYTSFSLSINNNLSPFRAETPHVADVGWYGRRAALAIVNLFTSKQDRIDYQNAARKAASFGFAFGGNTLTFGMGGNNYLNEPEDQLVMGGQYMQAIVIENFVDQTTGVDITATYVPAVA